MAANFASTESYFVIEWMNFMNGGGRQALSIFAAMLAVIGSRYVTQHLIRKPVKSVRSGYAPLSKFP
jgi:hypothetical protein